MDSKDREILLKIYKHARNTIEYTEKYTIEADFEKDSMCVEATVFNLMQIGELAKKSLSNELKDQITSIPWNQIYGLRNRIVHGYDGVNMMIVWEVVKNDIPILCDEINKIV